MLKIKVAITTNMEETILHDINEVPDEYTIHAINMEGIIKELQLPTEDDELIYEAIIDGIESNASAFIKANKVAQLPSVGCLRKNPIRQVMKDNQLNLRIARKHMTKEQYKDHARCLYNDAKKRQEEADRFKYIMNRIRIVNRAKYEHMCKHINRAYAELYLLSIYLLEDIPFDPEVEEVLTNLRS